MLPCATNDGGDGNKENRFRKNRTNIIMRLILQNIRELVQVDAKSRLWVAGKSMAEVQTIKNAFLIILFIYVSAIN